MTNPVASSLKAISRSVIRRALILFVLLTAALGVTGPVANADMLFGFIPIPSTQPANVAPAAQDILNRINVMRAGAGMQPLILDAHLSSVAQGWAGTMSGVGLSHNPGLKAQIAPGWQAIGENVAYGSDINLAHNFLVNSPRHFANMMNPNFNRVGVGVVYANGMVYIVEDFARY